MPNTLLHHFVDFENRLILGKKYGQDKRLVSCFYDLWCVVIHY